MTQEFVQAIVDTVREELEDVHTAVPGKITKYNTKTGLATVKPIMKFTKSDGDKIDYPQITGVPVVIPQANSQKITIAYPIKKGDTGLLICSEDSLDYWLYGKDTDSILAHDLTNAIFIPGLFKKANSTLTKATKNNSIIIKNGSSKIEIKNNSIKFNTQSISLNGSVKVNGNSRPDNIYSKSEIDSMINNINSKQKTLQESIDNINSTIKSLQESIDTLKA